MKNEKLISELRNLTAFFNACEIKDCMEVPYEYIEYEDPWTEYLKVCQKNDTKDMAFFLGRLSLMNWPEEEKILWQILLCIKCKGSETEMKEIIQQLNTLPQKSYLEELLTLVGSTLARREMKNRKENRQKELESLGKVVSECKEKLSEARSDLYEHSRRNGI